MKFTSWLAIAGLLGAAAPAMLAARAAEPTTLTIFAAGTLAVPFKQATALFEKQNPNVTVQAQFGGSVKMAKQITDLHQDADILAVADYNVIPKYMFGTQPLRGVVRRLRAQRHHLRLYRQEQVRERDRRRELVQGAGAARRRDRPFQSRHRSVRLSDRADAQSRREILQGAGPRRRRTEKRAACQYARHRNRADRGAAARPDRLSGDLPLRRACSII